MAGSGAEAVEGKTPVVLDASMGAKVLSKAIPYEYGEDPVPILGEPLKDRWAYEPLEHRERSLILKLLHHIKGEHHSPA